MTAIVFHLTTENITTMTYAYYVQHRCLYVIYDILQFNVMNAIYVKDPIIFIRCGAKASTL